MEENTSFDLNRRIEQWRSTLLQTEGLRRENVEELELHLRDSVAQLETRGLSSEEAFLIAVRRMGGSGELAGEFTKVNQKHVWRSRLLWMLGGVWLFHLFGKLMNYPLQFIEVSGTKLPVNFIWAGILCWAVHMAIICGLCCLVWWLLTSRERLWDEILDCCSTYPARTCAGLVVLTIVLYAPLGLYKLDFSAVDRSRLFSVASVENFTYVLVQSFAIPPLLFYLLRRQTRQRRPFSC